MGDRTSLAGQLEKITRFKNLKISVEFLKTAYLFCGKIENQAYPSFPRSKAGLKGREIKAVQNFRTPILDYFNISLIGFGPLLS
jgi:hypothetical protein